ncbi:MAG: hypothetical protein JXA91_05440 [Candidatus Thermoplasmatota archaeon]|nr:hypothetical protein [Candidatus Thermoplasmatota archaeon]
MEYIDLKILAVTRMLNQICVAGIDDDLKWRRPVRRSTLNILLSDIFDNNTCIIKNYNQVRFRFECNLNNVPHSEDFSINTEYKPILINELSIDDLRSDLNKIDESENFEENITSYLIENNRSLALIKPDEITGFTWFKSLNDKYQPRIQFELNNEKYDFSCTDLKWRAYGKSIANIKNVEELIKERDIYFAIGLTRKFMDKYWPMVVGIHILPDYECKINYKSL